jgi:uncharacterized RDD family membrane protein YckC
MEPRQWHYASKGGQVGPIPEQELVRLFHSGQLTPDTLVWTQELKDWVPASSVDGLLPPSSIPAPQPPPIAPAPAAPAAYAGFWRRAAAYIIDTIILTIGGAVAGGIAGFILGAAMGAAGSNVERITAVCGGVGYVLGIVLNWLYFTLSESSAKRATLGKMALGIVVTDLEGRRISFGRANGRHWSKILSALMLLVGFLMVAFTSRKQGLHDMIAGCLVVKK